MTATLQDWPVAPPGIKPAADEVHVWAVALDRASDEVSSWFGDQDADARLARAERLLARLEDAGRIAPARVEELHVALRSIAPELACV